MYDKSVNLISNVAVTFLQGKMRENHFISYWFSKLLLDGSLIRTVFSVQLCPSVPCSIVTNHRFTFASKLLVTIT